MPGKKKKFNSRFPPARIKKIMQTDEEVGKVAAAVPVIISRGLELFVESLLTRAGEITTARHARTLTPAHLKQCIMADKRFDFLQELVASVADISAEGESDAGPPTPSTPLTPLINLPLQGIGLHPSITTPAHALSHVDSYPSSPTKTGDDRVEHKSPHGRGRGRGRGRSRGRGHGQGPDSPAVSITRGAPRPRGRPRKMAQLLLTTEDLDSDDGLAISVDTDPEETDSETSEDEVTHLDYSGTQCKSKWATESRGVSQHNVENPRFIDDSPKLPGVQITIGEGYSSPLPAGSDNSKINPTFLKIGPPPPLHPLSTSNSTPGIQISIPALPIPNTGDMRTKDVISPDAASPVSSPSTPLTTNDKPAFGVPVPVITSVYSAKNQLPVNATYSPPSKSIHSHYLVKDEIDEEYDS